MKKLILTFVCAGIMALEADANATDIIIETNTTVYVEVVAPSDVESKAKRYLNTPRFKPKENDLSTGAGRLSREVELHSMVDEIGDVYLGRQIQIKDGRITLPDISDGHAGYINERFLLKR